MRNLGFHFHQLFFKYQYFSLTQVKVSFLILFKFSTNSKLANCELLGKSASIHLYQFSQTLRLQVESDELWKACQFVLILSTCRNIKEWLENPPRLIQDLILWESNNRCLETKYLLILLEIPSFSTLKFLQVGTNLMGSISHNHETSILWRK